MVNNNIDCSHEWKCSDVPGVFNCLSCTDIRTFDYKSQNYNIIKEKINGNVFSTYSI